MTNAEMAVRFLPARTIGGDLYDFLDYGPGQTAIVLGDVSGKAAPAALFAALVSGIMRSAAQQQPGPAADAGLLNDALQERKLESQYVTMLFALWNDESQNLAGGQLRRGAAGLLPRRHIGDGARRRLSAGDVSRRDLR